ncbi:MAG: hypothetical protein AAF568_01580, partial [Pseudomonadota bacterium]
VSLIDQDQDGADDEGYLQRPARDLPMIGHASEHFPRGPPVMWHNPKINIMLSERSAQPGSRQKYGATSPSSMP